MRLRPAASLSSLALAAIIAGCGGGGGSAPTQTATGGGNPSPQSSGLAGTVAVGAAITQGKVRIIDATGTVVAADIAVAADGSYTVPTLTGTGPWRIEACGYAGPNYECIYSVAAAAGTANVTPLTSATVLLAAGAHPSDLMTGSAPALTTSAVGDAQAQLRTGLSGVMSGNVPAGFDFVTGSLQAGSRTGYDKLLDAVGVSTGVDGNAFVQITPRQGSGNLYLEKGSTSGQVTVDTQAAALPLDGLDALFARMSAALASSSACSAGTTGMAAQMASNARMPFAGSQTGPAAVGAALCGFFGFENLWGAQLLSPTLGKCEAGASPRCHVSFVMQSPDGLVQPVGHGMAVARENGAWKFLGSYEPLSLQVGSRAQRVRRIDAETPVDSYDRAIAVDIQNVTGLACAKVSQRNAAGEPVTVAYFKPWDAGTPRLSAWRDANGERSLTPASGQLRDRDDTWLMLPAGDAGDAVVRNFFRGGRTVTIALYGDSGCTQALAVGGASSFDVEVEGVPPVWAQMPSLPWPELTDATVALLRTTTLAADAGAELAIAWTTPRGKAGFDEAMFCSDASNCGDGSPGRIGVRTFSPALQSLLLPVRNGATPLGDWRMLSLYGSGPDGINLQANFVVCGASTSGQGCQ